jgi:pilus assembly protein CpaF
MKILSAGHPVNSTYHSESSEGAIQRFLTAYLAESGNEPSHLALAKVVSLTNMIVVQKILRDGSRRVIQISEIVGVKKDDKDKPEINDLYIYDINKEPEYDEAGRVKKIYGVHKRVGKLSQRTINKFKIEGISETRYDFLLKDVDPTEVETYTGHNIEHYGMKGLDNTD